MKKILCALVLFAIALPIQAGATTLVLACGGLNSDGTAQAGIYDISTTPATKKWGVSYSQTSDIYDSCQIVNNGTQVLVSADVHAYLFNLRDGSVAKTWTTKYSHSLTPISPGRLMASSAQNGSYLGAIQTLDYTQSTTSPLSSVTLQATHTFLPIPGKKNEYYAGWYSGISHVSIPAPISSSPSILIGQTFTAPTIGVHDMIYDASGNIIASTNSDVYSLNLTTGAYTSYFGTAHPNIKSLSLNSDNSLLMYVDNTNSASNGQTMTLSFGDGTTYTLPQYVYRAKWVYQDANGVYSTKD